MHHDRRLLRDPPRLHAQGRRREQIPLHAERSVPSESTAATTSSSRTATSPTGAGSIPKPASGSTTTRPSTRAAQSVERLIVQRCKLHHPTFDGSTWYEPTYPTHTMGPQCITLFNTGGQPRHPLQRVLLRPGAHVQRRHRRRQQRQLSRLARARFGHLRQSGQPLLGRRPGSGRRQPQRARLGQLHHAVHDDDRQRGRPRSGRSTSGATSSRAASPSPTTAAATS